MADQAYLVMLDQTLRCLADSAPEAGDGLRQVVPDYVGMGAADKATEASFRALPWAEQHTILVEWAGKDLW